LAYLTYWFVKKKRGYAGCYTGWERMTGKKGRGLGGILGAKGFGFKKNRHWPFLWGFAFVKAKK